MKMMKENTVQTLVQGFAVIALCHRHRIWEKRAHMPFPLACSPSAEAIFILSLAQTPGHRTTGAFANEVPLQLHLLWLHGLQPSMVCPETTNSVASRFQINSGVVVLSSYFSSLNCHTFSSTRTYSRNAESDVRYSFANLSWKLLFDTLYS